MSRGSGFFKKLPFFVIAIDIWDKRVNNSISDRFHYPGDDRHLPAHRGTAQILGRDILREKIQFPVDYRCYQRT
jgi:hypothetical protein